MAQGGGIARVVNNNRVVGGIIIICVLQCVHLVEGATYVVGGSQGWNLQSQSWALGKKFKAGDILVFNYDPSAHNLAVVNAAAYRSCSTAGSRPLASGSDKVTLSKGGNYFICSSPSHCTAGMKMAVIAT